MQKYRQTPAPSAQHSKSETPRRHVRVGQIVLHIVLTVLVLMVLFPFYILIVNSFKLPADILLHPFSVAGLGEIPMVLSGYTMAWGYIKNYLLNTFFVALCEIFGVVFLSSVAAYGFTRFRFLGKNIFFTAFLAFMMIPGILTLAPSYAMVYSSFRLGQSLAGVILPAVAGSLPVSIFLLKTFFAGVPDSLFEAAALDGASHLKRYFILALPLSLPILFTVGLTTLLSAWNDIIWARLILYGNDALYTISVGVFVSFNATYNQSITDTVIYAGYVIASLPLLIAFFLTSKQFIQGLTTGAIKM